MPTLQIRTQATSWRMVFYFWMSQIHNCSYSIQSAAILALEMSKRIHSPQEVDKEDSKMQAMLLGVITNAVEWSSSDSLTLSRRSLPLHCQQTKRCWLSVKDTVKTTQPISRCMISRNSLIKGLHNSKKRWDSTLLSFSHLVYSLEVPQEAAKITQLCILMRILSWEAATVGLTNIYSVWGSARTQNISVF